MGLPAPPAMATHPRKKKPGCFQHRRDFAGRQCLGLGSLYSHTWDDKSARLGLLDTSLLGEPPLANWLQPVGPMGNGGVPGTCTRCSRV